MMGKPIVIIEGVPQEAERPAAIAVPGLSRRTSRFVVRTLAVLATLGVLYFVVLGTLMQRIDARPGFVPPAPVQNGSHAVNMAQALILREVDTHRWWPNDPFFYPTAFHDNMPNFQRGMMRAISRFVIALEMQIGRLNDTTALDADLERAAGLLQFPTDIWIFDFNQSFLPVQSSDSQYRMGAAALGSFNRRLAAGLATFERRPDTLVLALERMIAELGARAAEIDRHLQSRPPLLNWTSDNIFYFNKGKSYASFMLLRELGRDFEEVLVQNRTQAVWNEALDSLRRAAQQRPLIVLSARNDASIFANHLHLQGFYIKRALMQLNEVVRSLRNSR